MKKGKSGLRGMMIVGSILLAALSGFEARAAAAGDLDRRLALNVSRLEQSDYTAAAILQKADPADWPGDIPGRLIMAWTAIAQTTGHEPPQLKPLIDGLPGHFNKDGYLGPLLDLNAINEQQLSGHGWLIAGLCRYSAYSRDSRPREWAAAMIKNLALPLAGRYHDYPRKPDDRNRSGRAAGALTGRVINGWKVSTDVGCCHILLEGLVEAYRVMPSPQLQSLIEEVCESFLATDVRAVQAQAHASLCAARNVLLFDEMTGLHHNWLPRIRDFYQAYHDEAMTETEANWNWFGRPSWSEPCAIVDSFLLTMELWRVTNRPEYLNDAQRIFYNGLGYAEKPSGGFGCDVFTSQQGTALSCRHWDVPWCCNMRGAIGLTSAMAARAQVRDKTLLLPFYADGIFNAGGWIVEEQTGWPLDGQVALKLHRDAATPQAAGQIGLFVPAECAQSSVKLTIDGQTAAGQWRDGFLTVSLPQKDSIEIRLEMDILLRSESPHNHSTRKDLVTLRYGFLVLATPDGQRTDSIRLEDLHALGHGRYRVKESDLILEPLSQMPFSRSSESAPWRGQFLFNLTK